MDDDMGISRAAQQDLLNLGSYLDDINDDSATEGEELDDTSAEPKAPSPQKNQATTWKWDSQEEVEGEDVDMFEQSRPPKPKVKSKRPIRKKKGEVEKSPAAKEEIASYIRERKVRFEMNRKRFGEAGLKLPPTWDGIEFDISEETIRSSQKPNIRLDPVAPDEDFELEYSGGYIPAPIARRLRDYQIKGAAFMHEHFVYQRGGILGDDMGTGKTIQTIAFLTAAFGKTGDKRDLQRMRLAQRIPNRWHPMVMIICPGTLMQNWLNELEKWGYWNVEILHGSGDRKPKEVLEMASNRNLEIVITTYDTYLTQKDHINLIQWDCIIADEFHKLKNIKAKITREMNDINALCRIGLSGTVIQNNYDELWTLLNWTNPGSFGDLRSWNTGISTPLKTGQAHDASVTNLARARRTAEKLVHNLLPPHLLRRTKDIIADQLPSKRDRVVFCPLSPAQADAYQNLVDSDIIEALRTAHDTCECGATRRDGRTPYTRAFCCGRMVRDQLWSSWLFPAMMILQKLCNHLSMVVPSGDDLAERQAKDLEWLRIACPGDWKPLYKARDNLSQHANPDICGKWAILSKLLSFWHDAGDKILVFSHSVKLLKILKHLFDASQYHYSYLDGSTSYIERADAVDAFNANPNAFVFLISSKSGGVGLNITSANKVVIFDPHWNPSWDLQAQDRAFRIGQTRDVEVFRLVSAGTIEEIVYARQIYKQQMANIGYNASLERRYFKGVQGHSKGEIFGVRNMFAYQGEHVVLRDIVNKTNIAESKADVMVADMKVTDDDEDLDLGQLNFESQSDDRGLSQLADIITGKAKTKSKKVISGVEHILAQAGVEYTHDNAEVIGTSKVETDISRKAMQGEQDVGINEKRAFGDEEDATLRVKRSGLVKGKSGDSDDEAFQNMVLDGEEVVKFEHNPPQDVRMRQFCSMAKFFGYANAVEFARKVESCSQEERRQKLHRFYDHRRRDVILPELQKKVNG